MGHQTREKKKNGTMADMALEMSVKRKHSGKLIGKQTRTVADGATKIN